MENISREAIRQASLWMARLWADDVTEQDKQAFQSWLTASSENEFAWQQLEFLQKKFNSVPQTQMSRKVLTKPRRGLSRRQVLLLGGISLGTLGLVLSSRAEIPSGAEYVTATGEVRTLTLSDGTTLAMNTGTRVYVDFNQQERKLHLMEGEIMVTSSHHLTPFYVSTQQGKVVPIGTRFTVRQQSDSTQVNVYEGEVALHPAGAMMTEHLLAGEQTQFYADHVERKTYNVAEDALWLDQKVLAQSTPLTEFITDLARYRRGIIKVDSKLASLRLTGVFSTQDTDKTLYNISQVLPIEVHYRTALWVNITPKIQ